ncbi:DUF1972 domain-containing protein [Poritiphilus flavus]|uniref:DUF1972 domain-containing protein n=1 Tax=Poritiphilus flavus TaxID=2697053 RepID=A0A6L9E935_9FLAO|nr:DUF1972 domain-containing protein [Poritiphilus flavus]NAS10969.1 DUF1972 domain-containing protein [Poritiphilus flavus]
MKIGIIGTRGIPNNHGGFEQFAEYLSQHLVKKGHQVFVYNSHKHPFQQQTWKGVNIIHRKDPEHWMGTAGQFIYDLNCIWDSRRREFDVILQLGYTSSSVWGWLLPSKPEICTNMDGLEWKRSKYSKPVRKFLKQAEKWAVWTSDHLVADSIGIQQYLKERYGKESEYIAYGAEIFSDPSKEVLQSYDLVEYEYNMLIARLEPENNIQTILDGVVASNSKQAFLVVGKHQTPFGNFLKNRYMEHSHIRFLGGIYDINALNNLRYWSNLYFHGHSVGGTNPSLLEAMASNCLIIANNNVFNKSILGDDAFYFEDAKDITSFMGHNKKDYLQYIESNTSKILANFNWSLINEKYEEFMVRVSNI